MFLVAVCADILFDPENPPVGNFPDFQLFLEKLLSLTIAVCHDVHGNTLGLWREIG